MASGVVSGARGERGRRSKGRKPGRFVKPAEPRATLIERRENRNNFIAVLFYVFVFKFLIANWNALLFILPFREVVMKSFVNT